MEQSFEVVDSQWLDIKIREEFTQLVCEEKLFLQEELVVGRHLRSCSSLVVNTAKNRYKQFRPFDKTRVVLETIDGMEGSDYINANFVSGEIPLSFHKYIACQAPLENTVNDFWRMVWEQRCGVVVMLTDVEEDKAISYWPEEGKIVRYGSFLVCHKKNFELGDIQVRSLLVREATSHGKSSTREVIHLLYKNWPDFGIPTSTKVIRDLLVLITKFKGRASEIHSLSGPIVVHCSAGVGRTGVFLACHIALDCLRMGVLPNIKETVSKIREERQGLVRTFEQYSFIYRVLLDILRSNLLQEISSTSTLQSDNSSSIAVEVL